MKISPKLKMREELFWDTNPKKIDIDKHAQYVIERILDFGNDKEVKWVRNFYATSLIKKVVENPRRLRPRTKKLWTLLLEKR